MNLDRNLLKQARAAGVVLAFTILLGIVGGGLVLLQAGLLSHAITLVFLKGQTLPQIQSTLIAMLGVMLVRAVVVMLSEVSANAVAVRVKNNLRELLFGKLLALGPAAAQTEQSGELTTTVMQGIDSVMRTSANIFPRLCWLGLFRSWFWPSSFPWTCFRGSSCY